MKTINELKQDIKDTFVPHSFTLDDTLFGNIVQKGTLNVYYEGEDILVVSEGEVYNMNFETFLNFRMDAGNGRLFYQGDLKQFPTLKEAMDYATQELSNQVCIVTKTIFADFRDNSKQEPPVYFVSYLE